MRLRHGKKLEKMLDVGCGEGWFLDRFQQEGFVVSGVDFSSYGIEKWHPYLVECLTKGDYEEILAEQVRVEKSYHVIVLANIIEHVTDPEGLLTQVRRLLTPEGILLVVAPNDFSKLHDDLLESGTIDRPFWIAPPDHLSYFNKESMVRFLRAHDINVEVVVADNPVDLNLLNENSNYIRDPSKGRATHRFRVSTDLFLAGISEGKLLDLYTTLGAMGVGRNLTYYCSRA